MNVKRLEPLPFKTANGEFVKPNWQVAAATVFVFLHDGYCFACKRVCQQFSERQNQFAEWDAKVWLVWRGNFVPEDCQGVLEVGKARQNWLGEDSVGILVVDRYGIVASSWFGTLGKGFPSPDEVLSTVKQIALQCPE